MTIAIGKTPLPIINRKILLCQILSQPKPRRQFNSSTISRSVSISFERISQTYRIDSNICAVSIDVFWIY